MLPASQSYKVCPQCQTPAHLQAGECEQCGRLYHTQFTPPVQTQAFMPPSFQQPYVPQNNALNKPNYVLIILLWTLTVLSSCLYIINHTIGIVVDCMAICCAIYLTTTPSRGNKINGQVKLSFEFIALYICFLMGSPGALRPTPQPYYDSEFSDTPTHSSSSMP